MARTPLTLPVSGLKFRTVREKAGLEQIDVERLTALRGYRVHRTRLSRIETGQVKPTPPQLRVLVDVYGVAVEDVMEPAA